MFSHLGDFFNIWIKLTVALAILAVFGLWKIIEILIWLVQHISIS